MKIACLQFAPQVGDVNNNLNRADAVLSRANPQELDLLVLPELAFSGYNFKSLQQISPCLEHTTSGISALWARTTALKYECVVTVGYPEKVDVSDRWPASPEYYNSAITVNADGETVANYRKTFLYYRDETWALEGPDGFYNGEIPGLGNVVIGICMDLNPYKFEAPWTAWEFAYHILHSQANLVVISMAWMTRQDLSVYSRKSKEPDIDVLSYWVSRLEPVIRTEDIGEIIVVIANRCGTEDEAIYAGTSCVLGIEDGEVKVYGILGRGERELLVVDTTDPPQFKLVAESNAAIPMDTMQSRQAQKILDSEYATPLPPNRDTRVDTPFPSDKRLHGREALVASIDSVLLDAVAVSPVESSKAHAFFSREPPPAEELLGSIRSSVDASESHSSTTSISSSLQYPDSYSRDPVPAPISKDPIPVPFSKNPNIVPILKDPIPVLVSKGPNIVPILKDPIPVPVSENQNIVPILKDPTPPRSGTPRSGNNSHRDKAAERRAERRVGRRPEGSSDRSSERSRLSPKQPLEMIKIPPVEEWNVEHEDRQPDSASSMIVNTPWEQISANSRAKEIIKIMKAPTPSPPMASSSHPLPAPFPQKPRSVSSSSKTSVPVVPITSNVDETSPSIPILNSVTAEPILSSSKYISPPVVSRFVPPAERPQSPKSRNTSRTRTPHKEPALASQDLINQPPIAPIVVPLEEVATGSSHKSTADLSKQPQSKGGLAPRDERSTSPRPHSTGW